MQEIPKSRDAELYAFEEFFREADASAIPSECLSALTQQVVSLGNLAKTGKGAQIMTERLFEKDFTVMEARYAFVYAAAVGAVKQRHDSLDALKNAWVHFKSFKIFTNFYDNQRNGETGVLSPQQSFAMVRGYLETYFSDEEHCARLSLLIQEFYQ